MKLYSEDTKVTVPDGSHFVLGDNRKKSFDSCIFGFISKDNVVGEAKFSYSRLTNLERQNKK
ncbi:signal peptidase I [Bacillus carboniphilus]|uniref:Signal peptidase I n=1 Tax=Bacillus carboniphilus TaxID=86663 RepID=A0ABY9JYB6_9BACI|nr:signal peptidase I [Bacillus carboniphilus]WLR44377.1 signal peptidase I [Bacillus carboniphilus]